MLRAASQSPAPAPGLIQGDPKAELGEREVIRAGVAEGAKEKAGADRKECFALLLAGGSSRRMGRDKAELLVGGEPLWQRQVQTLRDAGAGRIGIARGRRERCAGEGLIAVADAAEGCGPLGGLVGGWRAAGECALLVLAVDLPLMSADFLKGMLATWKRSGAGVVPVLDGRFEPLAALYPPACRPSAEAALSNGAWSMQALVRCWVEADLVRTCEVSEAERGFFANANSPEEWAAIEARVG